MPDLTTPLVDLLGVKVAGLFDSELHVVTVGDLLRHAPRRYEHRGALTDLAHVNIGDHVTLQAQVKSFKSLRNKSKPGTRQEVIISDGTGQLSLMFFNQHWRERELVPGRYGLFAGQVTVFNSKRQLTHPEYELIAQDTQVNADDYASAMLPVYPATAKLQSWTIQRCIELVLSKLGVIEDVMPDEICQSENLMSLDSAFREIHQPSSEELLKRAQERLKWDEALMLQLLIGLQRKEEAMWTAIARSPKPDGLLAAFDARLPFTLTAGQQDVSHTLLQELSSTQPMHRLLQGEVGSGKTVVAVRAMLAVVDAGGQAALLAPTEVLAAQHYRAVVNLLGPLAERGMLGSHEEGTGVTLLTGSLNTATRRQALLDIASGQAGIVIGTHALLEDRVDFYDLGLVVIDEQHRFGVEQRATLVSKAGSDRRPHVLVMTATPIPRTVALTTFGALDISTLTELPAGRSPIQTHVVLPQEKPAHLQRAWERAVEEVRAGHQVYVVVPRIASQEDKDIEPGSRQAIALEDLVPQLESGPLADVRIGALHGQLSATEKDDIMLRFAQGPTRPDGIDVLVATTVIEVGVDVPNATMMIIMDADRFGMSQLHQLRGRVGRGSQPGICLLVTEAPPGTNARERLFAVASTTDGFEIAAKDLELRKEGDVLGKEQSGLRSSLRFVNLLQDIEVIEKAHTYAEKIVVESTTRLTESKDSQIESMYTKLMTHIHNTQVSHRADYVQKS